MADNKLQNTSKVDTNVSNKAALVTDLNSSYVSNEQYSYARNAVRNSKQGDLGTISNEPSNSFCFQAPYKIIGSIDLPDDTILIFSTDNTNSEIGIGNPMECKYTKLLNLPCLGFNDGFPITGVAKKDFQKGIIVTFIAKNLPVRRIALDRIGEISSCDDILLFKKITHPCISVKKGQVGNIPNGMYSVAIAYVIDNKVFSDWYSISNRVALHSETNSNSLQIDITGLDTDFKQFALAVVGNFIESDSKSVTKLAKIIGFYSTKVRTIAVTDFINPTYINIPLSDLVIQRGSWQKAGIISSNSNYLLIGDLVAREEENYQLKAMSIKAEYVVEQLPANYYEEDGQDVGFYRDENYDFYIQGVYSTGETTDKFHIPGRESTPQDLSTVSSIDVYEYDKQFSDCVPPGVIPRWKVENTAEKITPNNDKFTCDRRTLGHGQFGYYQSTELYPDNPAMFGEWANTPIRYHKFPDECKIPRYSIVNGKTYINILGVRFSSIQSFSNPDVVGYKITRSDRKGGNGTVVARGLMTNMRYYNDDQLNQTIIYSNYPVNDLSADVYLSSTQTAFKNNKENSFRPLTGVYDDKFTFYSPHTLFEPRYSLGTEVKIESEEVADILGQFEIVYHHPQQKLLNQFSFWLSAAVGFIESSIILLGKTNITGQTSVETGFPQSGRTVSTSSNIKIETAADLISLSPGQLAGMVAEAIQSLDGGGLTGALNLIFQSLRVLSSLALKGAYSVFSGIRVADEILEIIRNLTGYTDYVYQYNAIAKFNRSICVKEGNKRRRLKFPAQYIPSTVVSVNDQTFNNLFREKSVYLELNKPISPPTTIDNSRNTISGFKKCDSPTGKIASTGSAFYATNKAVNPNQYGQLGSSNPTSMHSCIYNTTTTPILYGGDCVITRFQFQKRMQFFSQNLANTNYPPGTEYDYRKYRNIAYPRYWMDSTKFDFSELLSNNVVNFTRFSRTTTSKYNLDCKSGDKKSPVRIDDAYMYLSNNAALDFFVEADYNPDFRDVAALPFYSKHNTNLSQVFRSDRLDTPEEFNISRAYSDLYTTEVFAQQQRDDFNPLRPIPVLQPNAVIYSLPSFNLQEVDNWQYFLPANYFSFRESDFGSLTGMHKLDQDRVIFLFSKSSPYISMGRDFLTLDQSGRKITIGDGGLFAQDPREIMPTDNNYGACNSRYAFSNTHLGRYYPSEKQGRILNFTESLDDITRQGMSFWCKNYMPISLYKYFPTYPQVENPISGVGYLTAFDSFNETVYITKRDFSPKKEFAQDIVYNNGEFKYKGKAVPLRNSGLFNDISWTLSYSPVEKSFVSWHDWHPDWTMQRDDHFLTVKDNKVYKHNEAYDNFCKFYGIDFPFEIEFVSSSGQEVHTVRSIEYFLEAYKIKNFGRDRFHVLNENFNYLIVHNTEQISPLLNLHHGNPNPEENLIYPKINPSTSVTYDIAFFKEESKYRLNMFWDSCKDRGEFTNAEVHLFPTDESGYRSVINPLAVDMKKPEEQRKKFRGTFTKFRLSKTVSGENKFLVKLMNVKKLLSVH